MFDLGQLLTDVTLHGTRLPWIDPDGGAICFLELDPTHFPPHFRPEDYWLNLPALRWPLNWGRYISANDVPFSIGRIRDLKDSFPRAEDPIAAEAAADALLEEAVANKKWTIPPKALVEINMGPFCMLEVHEGVWYVAFVCRTADNLFAIAVIDPEEKHCSFEFPETSEDPSRSDSEGKKINAAVKLLLSAIIRDFWVLEERESTFTCRQGETRGARTQRDTDEPRIVYLPRVRYSQRPDVDGCTHHLGLTERRAHFVRAHLRRAETPSATQLLLATRYGMEVPRGYTHMR